MKAYAIHTIHRKPDPKDEIEVITAGSVFEASKEDLDPKQKGSLARDGAARPATKTDIARHEERLAAEEERRATEIDPLAIRLDQPPESDDNGLPTLTGKNKTDLLKIASDEGVEVEEGSTNAQIVQAIESHRASTDAPAS